jgi:hypothetical protein
MSDLVEFLRARLAEDEQAARKAADRDGEHWTAGSDYVGSEETPYVAIGPWDGPLAETGEHIARHDPARVLAEVDAKRRIIAEHAAVHGISNTGPICSACGEVGNLGSEEAVVEWPCRTLRLLALPYAGHPDYDQDWALRDN